MIRLRQIKVPITAKEQETLLLKTAKLLRIAQSDIKDLKIIKKSLDARKKDNLFYVYEIDVEVLNEELILKKYTSTDIFKTPKEEYTFKKTGTKDLSTRPIVVGSGPAGLFAAYLLAENNYNPLIIERGEKVEERIKTIEEFWKTGLLNKESNVQFGEGGAGTFSDGKLNTLVKDKEFRGKKTFEIFVENGAPEEIMYESKPHIGTDILRTVIKNMREKIISMGGEFRYSTKLTKIHQENNKLVSIEVNNNEVLPCEVLILAIGHSARDTFEMLLKEGVEMTSKPFAVGVRIEHPQTLINESQYGPLHKLLPPASYKLTYNTKDNRGVYSFCMCPGGYVVNASSEENKLVVNGMSNYARESKNANSALVVTVTSKDFGEGPLAGIAFQRHLEELAYYQGLGKIPLQTYKDYRENNKTTSLGEVEPITKGDYTLSNLNEIFPSYINESLKEAIEYFDTKIKGYARSDALLLGVESRTSSPVRIIRDELFTSNIKGLFPCGEGAGYAGGITTAAMDGIKVAEIIASIYQSN